MAFISNDEINNIRAKANIVDIVGSYIPLIQRGKNYVCVCPFHDDHSPSMSVSEEKQIYKCFSCGATGNVFTFVENYENVSFIEAVSIVAKKCGMNLSSIYHSPKMSLNHKEEYEIMELANKFFTNNLKTSFGKEALNYLKKRGLTEETIKKFGIGLSLDENDSLLKILTQKKYNLNKLIDIGLVNQIDDNNYDMFRKRITFPLTDKDGNVVGFSARIYRGEKDVSKYMNSRENVIFKKGETLYNYNAAKDISKREKQIIVVEGFMDAIRLSLNGIENVVALCGTAMTNNQILLLKKLRCKVILCLDNDEAGLLATVNNGEELIKNNIDTYVIRLTGEKDPDEYIMNNGIDSFKNNLKSPLTYFEFKINYLKKGKDLNNIEDLSDYINSVLENLSNSTDEILKEVTLKKISDKYGISIEVLKNKLVEINVNISKKDVNLKPIIKKVKKDVNSINIEKVLYFMLNGSEYVREYQKKLGFIDNQEYREIANEIIYYEKSNSNINVADFITYAVQKDNIKDKVMNIVNESLNEDVDISIMDDYINAIKKFIIKNEITSIKVKMKNELDIDKKIALANQLAELKKGSVLYDRD